MDKGLPPLIAGFSALAADYDVLLCDVWGVIHNGISVFPHACDVLMRMRAQGRTVIFITNAPRPSEQVIRQLERLHCPREAFDGIVSSGDVTRSIIEQRRGQSSHPLVEIAQHELRSADMTIGDERRQSLRLIAPFEQRGTQVHVVDVELMAADADVDTLHAALLTRLV